MGEENSEPPAAAPAATFIEVTCRSTGKTVRFAAGTDAGFAVSLINRKLKGLNQLATHIEAVKDGEQEEEEETIAFGPTAILSNFGENWKLQTVLSFGNFQHLFSFSIINLLFQIRTGFMRVKSIQFN